MLPTKHFTEEAFHLYFMTLWRHSGHSIRCADICLQHLTLWSDQLFPRENLLERPNSTPLSTVNTGVKWKYFRINETFTRMQTSHTVTTMVTQLSNVSMRTQYEFLLNSNSAFLFHKYELIRTRAATKIREIR